MSAFLQDLLALVATVVLSLVQVAYGADDELVDGWNSWEAPAGSSGQRACCYSFRNGNIAGSEGCRLDTGDDGVTIDSDCDPLSDKLRIYVLVDGGNVKEIRALSAACPVSASTPVRAHAGKSADASIAWLDRYARQGTRLADEAVTAIAMHQDSAALIALTSMIEDPARGMDIREQALFWLAQSDDENAFRYIDGILSQR